MAPEMVDLDEGTGWSAAWGHHFGVVLIRIVLVSAVLVSGCSDVDIVGQCEPSSPAVRLAQGRPLGFGVLDGNVLLLHGSPLATGGSPDWRVTAQWFDVAGEPLGESEVLGTVEVPYRARFVQHEGALVSQLWIDPSGAVPAAEGDDVLAVWRFAAPPGVSFERSAIAIDTHRGHDCDWCGRSSMLIGGGGLGPGRDVELACARAGATVSFAVAAAPAACARMSSTATTGQVRLHHFDAEDAQADMEAWWAPELICAINSTDPVSATNPYAVTVADRASLFLRLGDRGTDGHLYFQPSPGDRPVLVGGTWRHGSVNGGFQPRAAAVGTGHILFTELIDDDVNSCHFLRRIDHEGRDSEETPWQLPCVGNDRRLTSSVALERLDNGLATFAWGERTSFGPGLEYVTQLTSDIDYEEGIYLALITEDGKRGSEIIEVTDSAATVLRSTPRTETNGPSPAQFNLNTAQEGDDIYVMWEDTRASAPGIYARRVTCSQSQ